MEIDSLNHEQNDQHTVTIWEMGRDRLAAMKHKLSDPRKGVGQESCSIFKVLQNLIDINGKLYEPHIVSIGPFHHGKSQLQMIQKKARECYSESITNYSKDEFIEMMVLDGCFIIELFTKCDANEYEPLLRMARIHSFFLRDLISLENQIPYFILECLFDLTKTPESPTLATLALNFFNYILQRPKKVIEKYSNLKVKFENGVIHMPTITIDDFMRAFLLNSVAFEQCHSGRSKHYIIYLTLLDCLINTSKDVGILCDWNIIENNLGTDWEVAKFINNIGKDISFAINECYLTRLFDNVNKHYQNRWHVHWASFKYTYFNTPWSFVSALAALVLLILTMAQTFYTVLSYLRHR